MGSERSVGILVDWQGADCRARADQATSPMALGKLFKLL